MQFAKIGSVTLHYQLIGAPAGKPVIVFANSLGTDFRIWRDVIVRLAGDFAIVTYDMRGHGLSDSGGAHSTMDDHVADLAGLLDMLDTRQVIVCGLSVGGLVAQGLYAARPDLVRALVLCDTAHKIGTNELWNGRIEAIRADGIEAIADAILERWFTPAFRAAGNADFAGYRNMLIRQPVEGYVATCEAIRDADFTERGGPDRGSGHLHRRRPGRLDAARSRPVDGKAHPGLPLRGRQGCRPHTLCRAAGSADGNHPRLRGGDRLGAHKRPIRGCPGRCSSA